MKEHTREEPKIVAAAERQMHAWVLNQEIADRKTVRLDQAHRPQRQLGPYVTISREVGACGSQIAEMVGEELGWEVLDKGLLDRVADRYRLSRSMLELVDETSGNWAFDILGTWLDRQIIPHEKYVAHLGRVVLAAARRGNVIFVGRGAQFLLPRQAGLAVRLVASEKFRVAQIMRRRGMDEAHARRTMKEIDQGRREFVRCYFHHDIDDPHLYDLVINTEGLGPVGAVEQIVTAIRR
jgi:aromatic ring-cleaving dioxygenase